MYSLSILTFFHKFSKPKILAHILSPIQNFKSEWISLLCGVLIGSIVLFISCCNLEAKVPARSPKKPLANEISNEFAEPILVWNENISSDFGERENPTADGDEYHTGIDIAADYNTPIHAVADGVIQLAEISDSGYGNHLIISHSTSLSTLYGHCSTLLVSQGQQVLKGDVIATVGSTGNSTGAHLHFEVLKSGEAVDPKNLLPNT